MKKITLLIILLCAMVQTSKASHSAAGELTYSLVPGETNQYKFILKYFRDCVGTTAPLVQSLCYSNQCGVNNQSITMNLEVPIGAVLPNGHIQGAAVPSGCTGANNTCNGGTLPGFQEYWYSAVLTLPSQCNSWHFWVFNCCRNLSIGNVDPNMNFFVETTYDNTNNQNFNSSPVFSQLLLPYVCVNIPVVYNNGAYDLNGDSLTYEIIEPRSQVSCGNFSPMDILAAPYNIINNPFPTNNTFNIDPNTGVTTFTPSATGTYVLTIKVNEYRNGNLIGHILRDLQFVVGNCTIIQPTFSLDTSNITGGYLANGQIKTCVGDTLHACFQLQSANALAALYATDNALIAVPGGTVSYTGTGTNLINACITWAPNAGNAGSHSFIVHTIDSSCATQGQYAARTDTIKIQVNNTGTLPTISIASGTNTAVTGTPITYTAVTNATPGYSIKWYRDNILSYTSSDSFWNTTMQTGNDTVYAVIGNLSSCFSPDSAVSNTIVVINSSTGIKDVSGPVLKIYPNPGNTVLNVEGLLAGDILKVYNILGNTVYTETVNRHNTKISIGELAKGIYTLVTIRNNAYGYTKFEKQ